ncbi:MAG: hypothetical protein NTY35_01990 [Planctomycetota bacterium]|nr:hypothetical protein [Planctomycetota bacterium]
MLLPLSAGLLVTTAAAQAPIYIDLSPGSIATDVTKVGNEIVVVGLNAGGVFRWTVSNPSESPLGASSTTFPKVSRDGLRVTSTSDVGQGLDTGRVYVSGGWVNCPSLGASCDSTQTVAYGISGDGLTVVGGGYTGPGPCQGPHAMAWLYPSTLQDLGGFFSDPASRALCANQDGTLVAGFKDLLNGTRQAARWVNGTYSALNWVDPSTMIPYRLGTAQGMNPSGTIVVGGTIFSAPTALARAAWRWNTSTSNAVPLPNLPAAGTNAQALDLSDDGSIIVGHSGGTTVFGTNSVIWLNNVPTSLHTYLTGLGTQGIAGYSDLGLVMACSGEGNVICGGGTGQIAGLGQPAGGWIVIFPSALTVGTTFCAGDGTANACPCGNTGASGQGCANSVNASGGRLLAYGAASLASDSVLLQGSGMPNSSALYFQGTTQFSGGLGTTFGDGLRCAAGTVIRLGTKANVSGASTYPAAGDPSVSVRGLVTVPGTREYQIWYRNADPTFCTVSTFNLSNGLEIVWGA